MSVDLRVLREPVPAGATGFEVDDARLADLHALVEKDDVAEVTERLDTAFAAGFYDVRGAILYLWACFREGGLPVLGEVLEVARALAATGFAGYGPSTRRQAHAARRLAWLFRTLGEQLAYHEARETDAWTAWRRAAVAVPLAMLPALDEVLTGELERARTPLAELATRLRRIDALLAPASPRGDEVKEAPPVARAGSGSDETVRRPPAPRANQRIELAASPRFFELLDKMEAFSVLVGRGDLARAAIIGDDLGRTLDGFDPRAYFPELFSELTQLISENIDTLAMHWAERDSLAWRARAQFYQVDLRRFVDGK